MPNNRGRPPRQSAIDDVKDTEPEVTARPRRREATEDDDRIVPLENVGGAVPTARGLDSGGDLAGPDDDLSNLAEPEPPEDGPEVGAIHVRRGEP